MTHPGADFAPITLKANATGIEKIGNGSHGFVLVAAVTVYGLNEISQAHLGACGFTRSLFHREFQVLVFSEGVIGAPLQMNLTPETSRRSK